jgi:Icc-related predicted phosphoesterase
MKIKLSIISDTHTKHRGIEKESLPGGDILIHGGDLMNSGYDEDDIWSFMEWYSTRPYQNIIFIAGNHDRKFQKDPARIKEILEEYPNVIYLEDSHVDIPFEDGTNAKIYGSPWQPEFCNWAFNLPREGKELQEKWDSIPDDTDIVITHGPARGILDVSGAPYNEPDLGCPLLRKRLDVMKPKIHICGHIHGGRGYYYNDHTHFFNASILDERYRYVNPPMNVIWDNTDNSMEFTNT